MHLSPAQQGGQVRLIEAYNMSRFMLPVSVRENSQM